MIEMPCFFYCQIIEKPTSTFTRNKDKIWNGLIGPKFGLKEHYDRKGDGGFYFYCEILT